MSDERPRESTEVYRLPAGAFEVRDGTGPRPSTDRAAPDRAPYGGVSDPSPESRTSPRPAGTSVPRGASAAASPRRRRVWDLVLTIVLLVVGAALAAVASVMALFLAFLADGCGATNCDYDRMNLGLWVALSGPWAVWAVALVVSIVLLMYRRLAFWMPLAGMALIVGIWFLGAWVAASGVG